jgi:hypothetical protein
VSHVGGGGVGVLLSVVVAVGGGSVGFGVAGPDMLLLLLLRALMVSLLMLVVAPLGSAAPSLFAIPALRLVPVFACVLAP